MIYALLLVFFFMGAVNPWPLTTSKGRWFSALVVVLAIVSAFAMTEIVK